MNGHCQRCYEKTNITTGSYFNTQMICMECSEKETNHKDYQKAKDAEGEQVKNGNFNFEGIGLPKDL